MSSSTRRRATADIITSGQRRQSAVNVAVVRPHELGAAELVAWDAMQQSTAELAHPFLSAGFALAAGSVRPGARVAVLEEGSNVVGFFAFERGRFGIGRPIAAGVSDRQAVVHARGLQFDFRELLKRCELDVWEFDHLVAGQLAAAGRSVVSRDSPIMDVSGGYDAYLDGRRKATKKTLKSTLYKQRKMQRDLGSTRFEFDVRDLEPLTLLMRWKSAQYRRTGRRDRFAVAWIERLVRELFDTRREACAGTLSVLYVDERVVAAHFGLRSRSSLACWFPAYDVSLARYSPGLVLHLAMAEAAAGKGIGHLDLGKGDEEYKDALKSGEVTVGEGWIERPSATALARNVQRFPRRVAEHALARHPVLRRSARTTLKRVGSLRTRRSRG